MIERTLVTPGSISWKRARQSSGACGCTSGWVTFSPANRLLETKRFERQNVPTLAPQPYMFRPDSPRVSRAA